MVRAPNQLALFPRPPRRVRGLLRPTTDTKINNRRGTARGARGPSRVFERGLYLADREISSRWLAEAAAQMPEAEGRDIAKLYGYDLGTEEGIHEAAREWLAKQAEGGRPKTRLFGRMGAAITGKPREAGFNESAYSRAELQGVVRNALRRDQQTPQQIGTAGGLRFSLPARPPRSPRRKGPRESLSAGPPKRSHRRDRHRLRPHPEEDAQRQRGQKPASPPDHAAAVANLDHLFRRSELLQSSPDRSADPNIVAAHRLYAPMAKGLVAKITTKEYKRGQGTRLYSVEAIAVEKATPAGKRADADTGKPRRLLRHKRAPRKACARSQARASRTALATCASRWPTACARGSKGFRARTSVTSTSACPWRATSSCATAARRTTSPRTMTTRKPPPLLTGRQATNHVKLSFATRRAGMKAGDLRAANRSDALDRAAAPFVFRPATWQSCAAAGRRRRRPPDPDDPSLPRNARTGAPMRPANPDSADVFTPTRNVLLVHREFEGLIKALINPSRLRTTTAGRLALQTMAAIKHNTLAIDTFHVSRVLAKSAFYGGGIFYKGEDGSRGLAYKRALALAEYTPADLESAVRAGDITPAMAKWASDNRPRLRAFGEARPERHAPRRQPRESHQRLDQLANQAAGHVQRRGFPKALPWCHHRRRPQVPGEHPPRAARLDARATRALCGAGNQPDVRQPQVAGCHQDNT